MFSESIPCSPLSIFSKVVCSELSRLAEEGAVEGADFHGRWVGHPQLDIFGDRWCVGVDWGCWRWDGEGEVVELRGYVMIQTFD